jgi:hypothetical protein
MRKSARLRLTTSAETLKPSVPNVQAVELNAEYGYAEAEEYEQNQVQRKASLLKTTITKRKTRKRHAES